MPAPKKNAVSSIAKKAVSKVRAGRAKKIEKKVDKFNDYMEYNRGTGLEYGYKKGKLVESEYGLPTGYSKKVKSRDLGKTFSSVKSPKKRVVKKSSMPIKKKK